MSRRRPFAILCTILLAIIAVIGGHTPCQAINFAAGARLPDGPVINLYPYWFSADTRTDAHGDPQLRHLGLDKYGISYGVSYYRQGWLSNIVVPSGRLQVDAVHGEDTGIGDLQLRFGHFLPWKEVTLLPLVFVKLPTGPFDPHRPVNFGDGQADVSGELYLNKAFGRLVVDGLLRYSVRLRNSETATTPGREVVNEWLVTWKFSDALRAGPAVNLLHGGNLERNGHRVPDSAPDKLALGGELYYILAPRAKLSLAAYRDVVVRNSNDGLLVMGRIVIPCN